MVLPDSEINNDVYREIYDIKTVKVIDDIIDEEGIDDSNELYKNKFITFETIVSCHSFSEEDFKEMWFMNIATSYLLHNIYIDMKDFIDTKNFMKLCYSAIEKLDDFKIIQNEINDIFSIDTVVSIYGEISTENRKKAVEEFLEKNKLLIKSEVLWTINK